MRVCRTPHDFSKNYDLKPLLLSEDRRLCWKGNPWNESFLTSVKKYLKETFIKTKYWHFPVRVDKSNQYWVLVVQNSAIMSN